MKRFILGIVLLFIVTGSGLSQTTERPLILPFQDPPGIDTWLLGQAYGNTTGAYRFGDRWYSAGQGLHFGLDFSAPCGTPLVAVADGTVAFVDNLNFGSAPHNVILRHDAIGLTSLYGHLQERAPLTQGQTISQGDFVGYSGDPDGTCQSRPHLHLEIRSLDYFTALNPVDYMDANWNTLALIGSFSSRNFQMDLDNARRWQTLADQPEVAFGGRILNNYNAPYPAEQTPPPNPPLARTTAPIADGQLAALDVFNTGNCCWEQWWHPTDPNQLFAIDGFANERAAILRFDANGILQEQAGIAPPPFYSPDFSLLLRPFGNGLQITNRETEETWTIDTDMTVPSVSPDNTRLLWVVDGGDFVPGDEEAINNILISDVRGGNLEMLFSEAGISAMWLDEHRLLLDIRDRPYTQMDIYDLRDNSRYTLGRWYRPRGFSLAPGGERMMFYLAYQPNPADNGVYWMDTIAGATQTRVDWFGAYRWRDATSLFYIPFDPATNQHQLMHYDITTSTIQPLTLPETQPFAVMDGRWSVNADGSTILFRNASDRNLWQIDIPTQ